MSTYWDWADLGYTPDNVVMAGHRWCKRGYHPLVCSEWEGNLVEVPFLDPDWQGQCEWCGVLLRRWSHSQKTIECDKYGNVDFYKYKAPF